MFVKNSGLNFQIKEIVYCAIYTHCVAHRLKFVLNNSKIQILQSFFQLFNHYNTISIKYIILL
jgi:hypothetical protein